MMNEIFKTFNVLFYKRKQPFLFRYIPTKETWVDCKATLNNNENGILIERKHKFLQTQYILSGAESCKLIVLDEKKQFVSVKIYENSSNAPFSFLISEPFVFLLPANNQLPYEDIQSMEIVTISDD